MFDIRRLLPWIGPLGMGCLALAGCAPKTGVSVTGDAPAQYSHVIVTVREIWFNTSATAAPADTSWIKFPLAAPVSFDLLSATNGVLTQIASKLSIPSGTYAQVRLIPVDASAALTSSASGLGAQHNSEVDSVDSAGKEQPTPLELQNPAEGIGIPTNLTITNSVSGSLGTTTNTTQTTGTTPGGLFSGQPNTTTTTTPGLPSATPNSGLDTTTGTVTNTTPGTPTGTLTTTGTTGTTTTTGTSSPTPVSLAINLNGSRDLVPFTFAKATGVLLNPHMTSFGSSTVGAIQGALTLSGLSGLTESTNRVNIQVTAEALSADGTRHVAVNSATVQSDGTFILYPLSVPSSSSATYDLVIHGPGIATIIVTGVSVTAGDPTTTSPVSIGTLVPRAATSYTVNLSAGSSLPAGALVGFYQTLPGSNQVPYLIEERPIDPFNRTFASNQSLPTATLEFGQFASGSDVPISTLTPAEGAGTYRVSAAAPLFNDGSLTTMVSAPPANTAGPKLVSVPALTLASGETASSISLTITQASAGKYNQGAVIVSHDGAIVATASLDATLTQGTTGSLVVPGIPGGSTTGSLDAGIYFISVRAWSSADPTGTLHRQAFATPVDLSKGSASNVPITID